jgi:hypothetical protein
MVRELDLRKGTGAESMKRFLLQITLLTGLLLSAEPAFAA